MNFTLTIFNAALIACGVGIAYFAVIRKDNFIFNWVVDYDDEAKWLIVGGGFLATMAWLES